MDAEELLQQALALHRQGDLAAAEAAYHAILAQDAANAGANLNLASLDLDRDRLAEAAARLQGVIARNEDSGVAHLLYSRALYRLGKHAEGLAHIRAAHELMPEDDGVATEYVSAVRRGYYTFNSAEYGALLKAAQEGKLPQDSRQRLAQLAMMRILRPELLRLIVEPGLPKDTPDAVVRWLLSLPEQARGELAILARNLVQAAELMQQGDLLAPQRATVTLRAGPEGAESEQTVQELADADTLTGATLEIVTGGQLKFLPYSGIRSIEFSEPAAAMGVVVTLRDGALVSGLMPLFYLFTEFAQTEKVRQGNSTLIRPVIGEVAAGVGIRALRADEGFIPVVRIERIDFAEAP